MTQRSPGHEWQADLYHRVSTPHRKWGANVLDAITFRGDERVLDAGCGTGAQTARILERVPRGHVYALDASGAMLEVARRELARFGSRVTFVQSTLAVDPLPAGIDVVFSNATFHWVPDHAALFGGIHDALVPGGRLHAQCGGFGNLRRTRALMAEIMQSERFAPFFEGMPPPWFFASVEQTTQRLQAAGFADIEVWLEDAPTPFPDVAAYAEFVRGVVLGAFLPRLPEPLRAPFVDELAGRAARTEPALTLDYVRLNLRATRPR
ncbi:MAG TPA: methyltransferase domain-containing protein [Kofleriaceae bacterium]|nr:methyltransferase domain-containing protein [Kofleriaceae bacterium]